MPRLKSAAPSCADTPRQFPTDLRCQSRDTACRVRSEVIINQPIVYAVIRTWHAASLHCREHIERSMMTFGIQHQCKARRYVNNTHRLVYLSELAQQVTSGRASRRRMRQIGIFLLSQPRMPSSLCHIRRMRRPSSAWYCKACEN